MNPEQIADVLDDAADYIEKHGWCQSHLATPDGRVCAQGAIKAVTMSGGIWQWQPLDGVGMAAYVALRGFVAGSVTGFNDTPERTEQEVLDAFRAAAKQQRSLA